MKPFGEGGLVLETIDDAKMVAAVLGAALIRKEALPDVQQRVRCTTLLQRLFPAVCNRPIALPVRCDERTKAAITSACEVAQDNIAGAKGFIERHAAVTGRDPAAIVAGVAASVSTFGPGVLVGPVAEAASVLASDAPAAVSALTQALEALKQPPATA